MYNTLSSISYNLRERKTGIKWHKCLKSSIQNVWSAVSFCPVHGAKWYSTRGKIIQYDFSHLRFKYSRRSTEITINTIKQFIMLYIATEIWLNKNSFLNFLSHIGYHSCFMFCHGAKWYCWPPIINVLKNKMVFFWHSSINSFSCNRNGQFQ